MLGDEGGELVGQVLVDVAVGDTARRRLQEHSRMHTHSRRFCGYGNRSAPDIMVLGVSGG